MTNSEALPVTSLTDIHLAPSANRIPELDGLRGLAILLVLICHYLGNATHAPLGFVLDHIFTVMSVGWSGVDLFFVLSGFLIGGILLDSRNSPSFFRTFYIRRVHRILPIYYLWIFLYIVLITFIAFVLRQTIALPPDDVHISPRDLTSVPHYLTFTQNIFYSPTPFEWIWFTVTWSLAIEEQFYLIAPPLIRFLSRKLLIIILIASVVLAPVLRYVFFKHFPSLDHFYQFGMPCRSDALSLGILTAVAWRWVPFRRYLSARPHLLPRIVIYLGVGIVALLWWLARPANSVTLTIGYSLLAFFYVALLILVLSQTSCWPARLMRARWLGKLGGISYCVYLIHLTINQLAHRIILHAEPRIYDWRGVLVTICSLILTLSVATISWRFLEKPLIRRGHMAFY
jgi:peptidoglycan/LPS O-acetylase OafA/YrhL